MFMFFPFPKWPFHGLQMGVTNYLPTASGGRALRLATSMSEYDPPQQIS